MKMLNFDHCQEDYTRAYGGMAGRKIPIIYQNEAYLLKLPGNLKDRGLKNVELSYSNSPFSEYIGSHIYEILGVNVHKTLLGIYHQEGKEKIVCACKDFESDGGKLLEFRELKVSFSGDIVDSEGYDTDGNGTDLVDTLQTILKHPILQSCTGVMERFWDMFVVDAFIGNPDRNNGNWGILVYPDKKVSLAPVYDNGSSLNCRWSDERMKAYIEQRSLLENQAYRAKTCIYKLHGRNINPYHLIQGGKFPECDEAVKRIVSRIDLLEIKKMIDEIPCMSEIRKQYYKEILSLRMDKILEPTLNRIQGKKQENALNHIFGAEMRGADYKSDWILPKGKGKEPRITDQQEDAWDFDIER